MGHKHAFQCLSLISGCKLLLIIGKIQRIHNNGLHVYGLYRLQYCNQYIERAWL